MLEKARRATRAALRRLSSTERHLRQARWLASIGDWAGAATAFASVAAVRPRQGDILVQWGHALKESGETDRATKVYRKAALLDRSDTDVRIHLAALLRLLKRGGDVEEAQGLYRDVLLFDPSNREALNGLIEMGARSMVPLESLNKLVALQSRQGMAAAQDALRTATDAIETLTTFPLTLYSEFRVRHPLARPPILSATAVTILVLATDCSAAMIDATLHSLSHQAPNLTRILVVTGTANREHPVSTLPRGKIDIQFVTMAAAISALVDQAALLVLPAGIVLEDEAVAWLSFARDRSGAAAVYGDHDHLIEDASLGRQRANPVLFGSHDPLLLRRVAQPPAAVLTSGPILAPLLGQGVDGWDAVAAVVEGVTVAAHVPRVLASRLRLAPSIRSAPMTGTDAQEAVASRSSTAAVANPRAQSSGRARLAVIIPTRDHAALLRQAVGSLVATASKPERLAFVIVDNCSREADTAALLASLTAAGASIISFDQPFNWSRANNAGVGATDADGLVFANNDVQSLTRGWDDIVEQGLNQPQVGVMGARLLFPDRSYQHAGVLFGVGKGMLVHEAVGKAATDGGPNNRWFAARRASAVTGAFLACTRATFEAVGGFDERLAIAYNDLDFCFRARALGKAVVYEPALCLLHHESKTRGQNVGQGQLAWDERERIVFARSWSADAFRGDPAYNPQWAKDGVPFDGLREPSINEIVAWIDAGATDAWAVQST